MSFFVSRLKKARESDEELDILKLLRGQELVDMPVWAKKTSLRFLQRI